MTEAYDAFVAAFRILDATDTTMSPEQLYTIRQIIEAVDVEHMLYEHEMERKRKRAEAQVFERIAQYIEAKVVSYRDWSVVAGLLAAGGNDDVLIGQCFRVLHRHNLADLTSNNVAGREHKIVSELREMKL